MCPGPGQRNISQPGLPVTLGALQAKSIRPTQRRGGLLLTPGSSLGALKPAFDYCVMLSSTTRRRHSEFFLRKLKLASVLSVPYVVKKKKSCSTRAVVAPHDHPRCACAS
jgi:hypothetical protein